ncbi:hypothetical protein Bca4012_089220 [Brassica carinata]
MAGDVGETNDRFFKRYQNKPEKFLIDCKFFSWYLSVSVKEGPGVADSDFQTTEMPTSLSPAINLLFSMIMSPDWSSLSVDIANLPLSSADIRKDNNNVTSLASKIGLDKDEKQEHLDTKATMVRVNSRQLTNVIARFSLTIYRMHIRHSRFRSSSRVDWLASGEDTRLKSFFDWLRSDLYSLSLERHQH